MPGSTTLRNKSESMNNDQENDKANEKAEEFTAEQIRQLYSQSVSSAPITVETDNGSTIIRNEPTKSSQRIMDGKPVGSYNKG